MTYAILSAEEDNDHFAVCLKLFEHHERTTTKLKVGSDDFFSCIKSVCNQITHSRWLWMH